MNSLKQKLSELDSILVKNNAPLVRLFNDGLPKEEIISFFQKHDIIPLPSLVTLYEWHNGVATVYGHFDQEVDLIPFGALFNLQEMLLMREIFREWGEDYFEEIDNYLPFMGTGESDMFVLNLTTGKVLRFQPMIQINGEPAFDSIETLVGCIMECFDTGAYQVDSEKGILIDMDKYFAIEIKNRKLSGNQSSDRNA